MESLAGSGGDGRASRDRVRRRGKREAADEPSPDPDAGYELTEEDREWARRTVAALPPLTDRQRDVLGLLLSKQRWSGEVSR